MELPTIELKLFLQEYYSEYQLHVALPDKDGKWLYRNTGITGDSPTDVVVKLAAALGYADRLQALW